MAETYIFTESGSNGGKYYSYGIRAKYDVRTYVLFGHYLIANGSVCGEMMGFDIACGWVGGWVLMYESETEF